MKKIKPFNKPIYITRPVLAPLNQVYEKIYQIWESKILTNMGSQHDTLEVELREYLKVRNLTLFCNGTLALQLAFQALELNGEVITTPFTFPATINSLLQNNLKPIFCDINSQDLTINPDLIQQLITSKTSAILPVHVFGNPCDIIRINQIAKENNLKVIYDAAHTFGVEYESKGIGNFGDINMFSFHATKIFHTVEGGALTYNNNELSERLSLLKNFGIKNEEEVILPGINAKMNELQAGIGLINLKLVDGEIEKRKKIHSLYNENLKEIAGIKPIKKKKGVKHNFQYYPILIDENKFGMTRDQLYEKLKEFNIYSRKYFYPLCTDYKFLKSKNKTFNIPNAITSANRILCLPIYGELTEEEINKICRIIQFLNK